MPCRAFIRHYLQRCLMVAERLCMIYFLPADAPRDALRYDAATTRRLMMMRMLALTMPASAL